ncbi:hypothetical protein HDV01_002511 [Terramyces sp. JEL0728]|nr:hypothetical protein HDV01_002511 [Terramyces sp. JEL0728]
MLTAEELDLLPEINGPIFKDGIPVFSPHYEEFKDFHSYIKQIEHYGYKSGILKIIPPKEWLEKNYTSYEMLKEIKISKPINQTFNCGGLPAGCQRQFNVEMRKNYSIQEWFEMSEKICSPPVLLESGKMALAANDGKKKGCADISSDLGEKSVDEYGMEIPAYINTPPSRLTPEYLQALERFYWRNVSFQTTMYGADMPGSIFTNEKDNLWNIAHLESLLSTIKTKIPGVNTPYLYFGLYKATFAWHVEDMDLFSINYIHFGAPKQWYVVPQEYKPKFERFASSMFYDEAKQCPEFLRHKTTVISPSILEKNNIKVNKIIQYANEFIVTFPDGYHQGYNTGFNCAESVNFALESWIPFGRKAHFCTCIDDSVSLDVNKLFGPDPNADPNAKPKKERKQRRLPKKKCCLCPLGELPAFPLYETEIKGIYCHYECGFYMPESWTEIDDEANLDTAAAPVESKMLSFTDSNVGELNQVVSDNVLHAKVLADIEKGAAIDAVYEESLKLEEMEIVNLKREFVEKNGKIMGLELVPKDRWKLRCSYCAYSGPADNNVGACVQCTKGKCLTAYHVSCALKKRIFIQTQDGILETYCQKHDPVYIQGQKLLKKQEKEREYLDTLTVGKHVSVKVAGSLFSGYITGVVASHGGCMVHYEGSSEPQFTKWDCLKLKEIRQIVEKRKKAPVYTDTKPRKKKVKVGPTCVLSDAKDGEQKTVEPVQTENGTSLDNISRPEMPVLDTPIH